MHDSHAGASSRQPVRCSNWRGSYPHRVLPPESWFRILRLARVARRLLLVVLGHRLTWKAARWRRAAVSVVSSIAWPVRSRSDTRVLFLAGRTCVRAQALQTPPTCFARATFALADRPVPTVSPKLHDSRSRSEWAAPLFPCLRSNQVPLACFHSQRHYRSPLGSRRWWGGVVVYRIARRPWRRRRSDRPDSWRWSAGAAPCRNRAVPQLGQSRRPAKQALLSGCRSRWCTDPLRLIQPAS
jgi:hypothetical protein